MTARVHQDMSPEKRVSLSSGLIDDWSEIGYLTGVDLPAKDLSNRVTATNSITVGKIEDSQGSQWVRVHGKGNFMSSPRLKAYVEKCLERAECRRVVVDLDSCPAIDSTFMGTLAGMAGRLKERAGEVFIVGLSERNRDSLESLGLASMLALEETNGESEWSEDLEQIREGLTEWDNHPAGAAAAEEVLEAHRKLCEVDSRNHRKFDTVLDMLEKECGKNSQNLK